MHAGAMKAASKKILGEVNANARATQPAKDDSEIGKASPGKISAHDIEKPAISGSFTRPATRPLVPKASSAQSVPTAAPGLSKATTTTYMATGESEPAAKIVHKKSTKVLRDAQAVSKSDGEAKTIIPIPTAPVHQTLTVVRVAGQAPQMSHSATAKPVTNLAPVQRQEVHKIESIPLRDETLPRIEARVTACQLPGSFESEQEYRNYLDYHNNQYQGYHADSQYVAHGPASTVTDIQLYQQRQLYDAVEAEYEYDDGYTTARSFGLHGESTGGVTTILGPRYTDKVKEEIRIAKEHVEATRPAEDIEDEQWDTSMVAEYGDEIFDHMRDLENKMAPNPRYMDQQQEIQWSMRAVLMDWVIQVHQRFNLLPETLFLTVNYIDRFLSCKIVSLGKLQLVGATAIFVAAKYEEVQCPTISEIIYMVDGGYSAEELLKAERFMLSMLQFELGWPGPMSFLRRISKADDYDLETRTLAKYFLEVTVMDERFVGCTPSFLAAASHCMARLMIYEGEWSKAHVYYSNYTWAQLRQLLAAMLECCEDPNKHHSAVYDKYTDKRYKRASIYVANKLASGFRLPADNPPQRPPTPVDCLMGAAGTLR